MGGPWVPSSLRCSDISYIICIYLSISGTWISIICLISWLLSYLNTCISSISWALSLKSLTPQQWKAGL